ncbi:hypothetical protein ACIREM_12330 [Streptomyces shenzhenensis]|uniref:hypothetical protein n=1 Tax=Streptomyces shenzhenensis TaxID=943815 RepID=UPI0037F46FAD
MEEVAAQRRLKDAITHREMGLRIGSNPHYIGSTTPKPRTEIIELTERSDVIVPKGRTRDAIHLPQEQRDKLIRRHAGTATEAQELDGELLKDIEGALWKRVVLDRTRVGAAPPLVRIIVAGLGQAYIADRNGFVRQHAYVLDDLSGRMSPEECMELTAPREPDRWAGSAAPGNRAG